MHRANGPMGCLPARGTHGVAERGGREGTGGIEAGGRHPLGPWSGIDVRLGLAKGGSWSGLAWSGLVADLVWSRPNITIVIWNVMLSCRAAISGGFPEWVKKGASFIFIIFNYF